MAFVEPTTCPVFKPPPDTNTDIACGQFGTRKIGAPQYRGNDRKTLLLDYPAEAAPEKLTARLTNRVPSQNGIEFTSVISLPEKGESAWRTIRMEAGQFKDAGGNLLPDWEHVEFFVLNGTNPANKPPVFKRLRWAE